MISIIVPAYNEEETIAKTVQVLCGFFDQKLPDYELVVVSDGSVDQTYNVAKSLESEQVRVFSYDNNRGKGNALRYGFEQSVGDPVVFFDSGLNFPPQQILDFLGRLDGEVLCQGGPPQEKPSRFLPIQPRRLGNAAVGELSSRDQVDLVIGSKRHPQSVVEYPFQRRVISRLAQILARFLFSLNITDTQVGLKVFRREALSKVMPLVLVKRYAFDIEFLALAHHFGFKIVEAPVNLKLKFSTAASPSSIYNCLMDALAVFYRLRIIKYYDKSETERERFLAEYPVTMLDKALCFILGDLLGREKR